MATSTPNYALVKPAYNEWADITVLNNNLDIIDTQIFAKASKTRQIIAGLGLTGGGDLTTDRTLNVVSATDGITSNADNIQLNTIDNLTTISSTKPLSATQGKWLKDKKIEDKGLLGTIDLNTLDATSMGVWYQEANALATLERNYPPKGLQAGYLGVFKTGVSGNSCIQEYVTYHSNKKFRRSYRADTLTWTTWVECYDSNNPQPLSDVGGVVNTTQIIAGSGLTGGGDLTTDRTINIASANDGIIANADNIQLDTQNVLTSTAVNKPLSANMGKVLQDTKLNLTGGTVTNGTNEVMIGVNYNNLSTDVMYMYTNATGTGIYNDMPTHGDVFIFSRNKSTGVVTYAGGAFSGNVTAPNIITDTSVGTCTVLFSGTQQCGQSIWKDTGIDIPTTYSSVVFEASTVPEYASQNFEFSRAQLASTNYVSIAQNNANAEKILVKIIGNRLWTYTNGGGYITDNNLLTVYGITRR